MEISNVDKAQAISEQEHSVLTSTVVILSLLQEKSNQSHSTKEDFTSTIYLRGDCLVPLGSEVFFLLLFQTVLASRKPIKIKAN